jgi:hypothetical protein
MKKLTRRTTADRIGEYVVKGVFAENSELAMERVALLLQKDNLLNLFANGVPTSVEIIDKEGLTEACKGKDRDTVEVISAYIGGDFRVYLKVRERCSSRYWKTQREADEYAASGNSYGKDCQSNRTDEYQFEGTYLCVRDRQYDGIDEFLDIEYV